MKKLIRSLNYIGIALVLVGFALLQSYGWANLAGLVALALGVVGLVAYFILNRGRLQSKTSRLNFIFASNLLIIVVLVVAIVAAVNYLGGKIHKRFDFSEGRAHSISAQSIQVVKNLRQDLAIKAFFSENNPSLYRFNALMEIYKYYSAKLKVETIDPYKNPSLVKRYEVKSDGTMVLEYGNKDTRIEEVSEEALTNAIIKVSRLQEKTIYFTQGHGEPDIAKSDEAGYSEVKSNLEKLAFKVKSIFLFQEAAIPADAAALVVAGPQKPLFEKELFLIDDFTFKKNGRLLLMLNPGEGHELKPLLRKLGVELEDNVVVEVDPLSRFMGGDYFMPVVAKYGEHAITRNFNYATMFPLARGLAKMSPPPKEVTVTMIASSSANSWGETNYESEIKTKKISKNPPDKEGPLDMMAAVEFTAGARVVVIGDSDFVLNKYYNFQANGNLFTNTISWLAEESDLVAIAPKTTTPRTLSLTQSSSRLIFFYTIIILPLLIFIAGIGIWLYRRKL